MNFEEIESRVAARWRLENRETTKRQAANSAIRCFFMAWACYLRGDDQAVKKWLAHVETLATIVSE